MKPWFALILSFTLIFLCDKVKGKCDTTDGGIADTDWAACLVAEPDGSCPHGFPKLDDDFRCTPYGRRTPPWKERVCCLLTPAFDLKIKDAPCLPKSNDKEKREPKSAP